MVAILAACGGGGAASGNATTVTVTLTDFKIDSSLTSFSVGVPYHFVVTNKGAITHEFEIMPPEPSSISADQVQKDALAGINPVPTGQTKTVDYTFTQAYASGALEFACHLAGHYDAGMHTPIVVNK